MNKAVWPSRSGESNLAPLQASSRTTAAWPMDAAYQKFCKVSALLHLLHQTSIWSTFEKFCRPQRRAPIWLMASGIKGCAAVREQPHGGQMPCLCCGPQARLARRRVPVIDNYRGVRGRAAQQAHPRRVARDRGEKEQPGHFALQIPSRSHRPAYLPYRATIETTTFQNVHTVVSRAHSLLPGGARES